jgi:hypothetical protein
MTGWGAGRCGKGSRSPWQGGCGRGFGRRGRRISEGREGWNRPGISPRIGMPTKKGPMPVTDEERHRLQSEADALRVRMDDIQKRLSEHTDRP